MSVKHGRVMKITDYLVDSIEISDGGFLFLNCMHGKPQGIYYLDCMRQSINGA